MKGIIAKKPKFFLFLTISLLAVAAGRGLALSPSDIVIVYNASVPGSKGVALFYAKERDVPKANLLDIKVTNSESISRSEFDECVIPPIRTAIKDLKKAGSTPAILLVYGIPLRVRKDIGDGFGVDFLNMVERKVEEYQNLSLRLGSRLDLLTKKQLSEHNPDTPSKSLSTKDVLKTVGRAISNAINYLRTQDSEIQDFNTRIELVSTLIRLTGVSPTARLAKKQFMEGKSSDSIFTENKTLLEWGEILKHELTRITLRGVLPEKALEEATIVRLSEGIIGELKFWERLKEGYSKKWISASVDSELTMVLAGPYQLYGWLPNPFLRMYDKLPNIRQIREETVMVGRIDGPNPTSAKRLITDAIATENTGLSGIFYIDARGLNQDGNHNAYALYDKHLINLYNIIKNNSTMEVVLDVNEELFPQGACPNAALYCGWYSLANYRDAFKWRTGAVGFHIASAEARTLRKPESNVWCKRMIEEGVSATLGPVAEPYLSSFPLPDLFFPLLMTGKLCLLEVYFLTIPHLSWRQVIIGDPLYTPFKKNSVIGTDKEQNGTSDTH